MMRIWVLAAMIGLGGHAVQAQSLGGRGPGYAGNGGTLTLRQQLGGTTLTRQYTGLNRSGQFGDRRGTTVQTPDGNAYAGVSENTLPGNLPFNRLGGVPTDDLANRQYNNPGYLDRQGASGEARAGYGPYDGSRGYGAGIGTGELSATSGLGGLGRQRGDVYGSGRGQAVVLPPSGGVIGPNYEAVPGVTIPNGNGYGGYDGSGGIGVTVLP